MGVLIIHINSPAQLLYGNKGRDTKKLNMVWKIWNPIDLFIRVQVKITICSQTPKLPYSWINGKIRFIVLYCHIEISLYTVSDQLKDWVCELITWGWEGGKGDVICAMCRKLIIKSGCENPINCVTRSSRSQTLLIPRVISW